MTLDNLYQEPKLAPCEICPSKPQLTILNVLLGSYRLYGDQIVGKCGHEKLGADYLRSLGFKECVLVLLAGLHDWCLLEIGRSAALSRHML